MPADAPSDPTPEREASEEPAEEPSEKPAKQKSEPVAAPAGEPGSEKPAESAPSAAAKKTPEKGAAAPAAAQSVEEGKSRPDDVVAWKDDDYRSAKEDRDPRLLDAVAYLGENKSGDARAAGLLVELLTTPEDPEPEPKPEPKVEKKPEKKRPSDYDEYSGMDDGYMPPMEEDMSTGMDEGYMGDEMYTGDEEMYMDEGGGGPGRRKAETKTPLAASYVSLTGGIVRALGANGTKEAREVFEQLLAGKVATGNERAAVGAVLRTLVDYPSLENDALLRKALTAPETYRPTSEKLTAALKLAFGAGSETKGGEEPKEEEQPKKGEKGPDIDTLVAASLANTVTAEDIRDTTLPLIEKSASMRLRYDLAAYLIGKPSEDLGPRLQEFVTVTHPLNLQAQVGLYRYPNTPAEMRSSFERYFTSYASCALGRMLAVSTDEGADLQETVLTGQEGLSQGRQQGWSGFGDSTKRPETPPGGSGPRSGGYAAGEGMMDEGYMPPDETIDPTPPDEMSDTYTGQEMDGGAGVAGGPAGGGGSKPLTGPGKADQVSVQKFEEVAAANPNLPYELAQQLWGNDLGSTLAAKMSTLPGLADGAQLLMLAGHIPTDAMRVQLLKTLQAHWMDGPEAFASASVSTEIGISDPGFIAIVKSLPRREPPARASKVEPTKEQSAQYAWMQVAYGTVRGFCEKFQKAADNQMVNTAEVIEKLPFRPHSADTITHAYAVDWQKSVGSRLTGAPVDPMRIYYLRFEETNLYNKVVGAYTRAVPSGTERLVKGGLWIDGSKAGPEPGRRTTMDVLIDRTQFDPKRKVSEPEPMVIQVLYVEINDPNPPKAAEAG